MDLEQGNGWMLDSVAQRILSGQEASSLIARYFKHLWVNDEARAKKLLNLCSRIEFAEQIQYLMRIEAQWSAGKDVRANYQVSRISIFLLTTCIDIAANEVLKGGGRKGFRGFLAAQPSWLREWISNAYFLMRGRDYLELPDWIDQLEKARWHSAGAKWKCVEIGDYLNDVRNKYSHHIDLQHPRIPMPVVKGKRYSLGTLVELVDGEEKTLWTVGVESWLPEFEVLRFALVVHFRRMWLDIRDDASFLDRYIERMKYRMLAYHFLSEVRHNREAVKEWSISHFLDVPRNSPGPDNVQLLPTHSAELFLKLHRSLHPARSVSFPIGPEYYIEAVERINEKISIFRENCEEAVRERRRFEWGERGEIARKFMAQLSTSEDAGKIIEASICILRDLERSIYKGMY